MTYRWGPQRPDLVRYNRVEGLWVGARGQVLPTTPWGPVSVSATAGVGTERGLASGRVDLTREGLDRAVGLALYNEVTPLDEDTRRLGLANSLTALLLGRDDGEYSRRAGVSLTLSPPSAERRRYRARVWAERHEGLVAGSPPALAHLGDDAWTFRPNLAADEGTDVGAGVELAPWWGTDPRRPQGGVTAAVRVGAGTWRYRVAELTVGARLPLPGDVVAAAEVAGGTSWGAPPAQRRFLVGGAATLRGYEPVARSGTSLLRTRAELARRFAFGAVSLFSDGAWAGARDAFSVDDVLWSAGVGFALVDGLVRADAAWGLSDFRRFRLELYLDGIL